jgi:hypothetical protein
LRELNLLEGGGAGEGREERHPVVFKLWDVGKQG